MSNVFSAPSHRFYTCSLALGSCMLLMMVSLRPESSSAEPAGKTLLEEHCGRCHSIGATGASPLHQAPPLRDVYLRLPIEALETGLAEGLGSRHRDMPQLQFSSEEVSDILQYLGSISGFDYSK